jgi:glycosyltransferase involved in cell wall biosynthesis
VRIHLHDFAGHPFQAQLSRELARRGHEVEHAYCAEYVSGKGALSRQPQDAATLSFHPHSVGIPLPKYKLAARVRYEHLYARSLRRHLDHTEPDITILCNVPLTITSSISTHMRSRHKRWVLWHQDMLSLAMTKELRSRLPWPISRPAGAFLEYRERRYVSEADAVIPIGRAFLAQYERWGLSAERTTLIPNWAPLHEIRPGFRNNAWAAKHDLPSDTLRLTYTGTLGRKHNPQLLLTLLRAVRAQGVPASLVIISEGDGVEQLRSLSREDPDVSILPFQSTSDLPSVLASADVLVALLEPEASAFSIPSKVLSYMAAGRPILALMPATNAAASDVLDSGGLVYPPTEIGASAAATDLAVLSRDRDALLTIGKTARARADEKFAIDSIVQQFEDILVSLVEDARKDLRMISPKLHSSR